jgi:hypothetical protein
LSSSQNSSGSPRRGADTARRIEDELREFVRWFNDDVVPNVRRDSGKALRTASAKLNEFAEYLERMGKRPH